MIVLATIESPIQVVTEGPVFRCIFEITVQNDPLYAGLEGGLGKQISGVLRPGDQVMAEGHFINEATYGKVFMITQMTLPKRARKGRNLNTYA
jgi:hypothetical protein